MKKITLKEAYDSLVAASAFIIEDDILVYGSFADLEENDGNEFLCFTWELDCQEFNVKFTEGQNKIVETSNLSMFLIDEDGEICQLTLLRPTKL